MLLPLSLHYLYIRFSSSNMCSHHIISLSQIVTLVTFTHYRPLKKQGLENCTTMLTFKHHQLDSQEWLDLTRIHTLKHCISRLQKVQLKLSILLKKKIQSLSTKQVQLSKLAAVMSTFCAQLHRQSKGKRRKQSPVRQI